MCWFREIEDIWVFIPYTDGCHNYGQNCIIGVKCEQDCTTQSKPWTKLVCASSK